jgi:CHAT domain-containing protein
MQGDDLLLAKYQISYLPSASTIQFLGKPKSNNWTTVSSLTVGNPSNMAYSTPFGEELDFQSLKGAGLEAEYIAHLTGGKKLSGEEATRANFLKWLPDYELLHFSTHGYLSEHFPLMSAILLANGEALTVYDLIRLQLKARLVVMSACQTGLGERKGGDDLLGLTRGLLGAGAESAIVTQWSVGDSSTAILMADMYRHLRKGSGTPAKALRKAQLQLRKLSKEEGKKRINELRASMEMEQTAQFSEQIRAGRRLPPPPPSTSLDHPFYWAAFVHIGV